MWAAFFFLFLCFFSMQDPAFGQESNKTPGEKLMDGRRLQFINNLWSLYWNRNKEDLSAAEQRRISVLMAKVRYPAVNAQTTPPEQVTSIIQTSMDELGQELENEIARIQMEGSVSDLGRPRENLADMHLKLGRNLEDATYWLRGDLRVDKAGQRYDAAVGRTVKDAAERFPLNAYGNQ
jgi:hypothetical protein